MLLISGIQGKTCDQ